MVKELVTHAIVAVLAAYLAYLAIGWTKAERDWEARYNNFQLRAAQAVRDQTEEMLARALLAQQYADKVLESMVMPIDIVHDGLPDVPVWDDSRFATAEMDKVWGGEQTGIWPMILELKDDLSSPEADGPEFPNLQRHLSREQLVTATGTQLPDSPLPEPVSPRKRFEDQVFTITLPQKSLLELMNA